MTDPPLISVIAMWVARVRRAHLGRKIASESYQLGAQLRMVVYFAVSGIDQ
jgi:hypothetical protein